MTVAASHSLLARGPATHDHGLSARGADFLPGSPRCTPRSTRLCQEAPDQVVHDLSRNVAYGLPGPVGVEVVVSVREAHRLHAPSIRMESDQCPVSKATEKFCGIHA